MRSTRAAGLLAVAATAMAASVSACGSSSSDSASGSGGKDTKVLYLLPTLSDEAYSREAAGAKAEAAKHPGMSLDIAAGQNRANPTAQVNKIENGVAKGVDVIVVDPGEAAEQLAPALRTAQKQGVKVITIVQPVPNLKADSAIVFGIKDAYVAAGKFMSKQLPHGGEIGVITCVASNADSRARIAGFDSGLAPNIKRVAFGDAKCDPALARSLTENMLTAHPNLKGIFNNTDLATVGTIEALRAAGKDLVVIGGDGQTPNLKLMAKGEIQDASPRYPSETFGQAAIKTAAEVGAGQKVSARQDIPPLPLITQDNAKDVLAQIAALQKQQ